MRKQRGVTMIGWIFLLVPVAIVLYAAILVGPEYLNYYKVITALKETGGKLKGDETLSATTIRNAITKRFDIGYIEKPTSDEVVITKEEGGWQLATDYETTVPMFGNLYLLMTFKTAVLVN